MDWIDVNSINDIKVSKEPKQSRPLSYGEIVYIEEMCLEDIENQLFPSLQEIKLGFKRRELLIGTLYHELGHLNEAMEQGFHFDYIRIGKRVFFLQNGELVTVKLKQLAHSQLVGCTATHSPINEKGAKEKYQAVTLAGSKAVERLYGKEVFSKRFEKIKQIQHPTPSNPYSQKFKYVANEHVNSDEWLWWHLELNGRVAQALNNIYRSIGAYLETEEHFYVENLGALEVEKENIIQALKLSKEIKHIKMKT